MGNPYRGVFSMTFSDWIEYVTLAFIREPIGNSPPTRFRVHIDNLGPV